MGERINSKSVKARTVPFPTSTNGVAKMRHYSWRLPYPKPRNTLHE